MCIQYVLFVTVLRQIYCAVTGEVWRLLMKWTTLTPPPSQSVGPDLYTPANDTVNTATSRQAPVSRWKKITVFFLPILKHIEHIQSTLHFTQFHIQANVSWQLGIPDILEDCLQADVVMILI